MRRLLPCLLLLAGGTCGDAPPPRAPAGIDATLAAAARYGWSRQAADGGWHSETYGLLHSGQSLTPFVLDALLDVPDAVHPRDERAVSRAVGFIVRHVDADGVLGRRDADVEDYPNYATALARRVLARLEGDIALLDRLGRALLKQQYREADGWPRSHSAHGAWGMGGLKARPPQPGHLDLSMTRYVLEGLTAWPQPGRRLAFRRAQVFLDRVRGPDGGSFFSTVLVEKNKAGADPDGGYRSYGTTTADGLLALRAAGVSADDPRVVAGRAWLVRRHQAARVPGFPSEQRDGWALSMRYYYRAAAARVFQALGVAEAPRGTDWRADLAWRFAAEQREDGSFQNAGQLMQEDDPLIATALAIKALAAAR